MIGPGVTASLSMLSSSSAAERIKLRASGPLSLLCAIQAVTSSLCTSTCFDQYTFPCWAMASRSSESLCSDWLARSSSPERERFLRSTIPIAISITPRVKDAANITNVMSLARGAPVGGSTPEVGGVTTGVGPEPLSTSTTAGVI